MSLPNFGDNYRGGYSTSGGSFITEELREASSTFANYISGTIYLTFLIFFSFMLLSIMTLILMGYARYDYLSLCFSGKIYFKMLPEKV